MSYIKKTIYLPYEIIVKKYHSSRYGKKGLKPAKRERPSQQRVKEANERRRIEKLYYLIATNFDYCDFHTQLTYKRENRPTPEEAREIVKRFLRRMRKEYKRRGKELKYIITTEYLKSSIHHHIILNEIGDTVRIVNDCWEMGKAFFTGIYKDGDVKNLAAYLIKETQRSFRDEENPNKLSYSCSRNLKKPQEKIEIVRADSWREDPKPPKGYIVKEVTMGISEITGYPYQNYTCAKIRGKPCMK